MASASEELKIILNAAVDGNFSAAINKSIGMLEQVQAKAMAVSAAFTGIATAGVALAGAAIKQAGEYEYLRKQLENIRGSAESAGAEFNRLRDFAEQSGKFTTEQFVYASNTMEQLKKGSSELLPAVAGLAEALGQDLQGSAGLLARALEGDERALKTLERSLGISKDKLFDFDSQFDLTGKNVAKNAEIIGRYMTENFGGKLAETSKTFNSALGTMQNRIKDLAAAVGDDLLPMATAGANALGEMLKTFREMDPATRKALVNAGAIVTLGAGLVGIGAGLIAAIGPIAKVVVPAFVAVKIAVGAAGGALATLGATMTWFLGPAAAMAIPIAGIAIALGALTLALKANADAQKYANQMLAEHNKLLQKDFEDTKKLNKFMATGMIEQKDIAGALTALQIKRRDAEKDLAESTKSGNTERVKVVQAEIARLDKLRTTLRAQISGSDEAKPGGPASGKSDVAEKVKAETEAQIKQLERKRELGELDLVGERKLLDLMEQRVSVLRQLGSSEDDIHKAKVSAYAQKQQLESKDKANLTDILKAGGSVNPYDLQGIYAPKVDLGKATALPTGAGTKRLTAAQERLRADMDLAKSINPFGAEFQPVGFGVNLNPLAEALAPAVAKAAQTVKADDSKTTSGSAGGAGIAVNIYLDGKRTGDSGGVKADISRSGDQLTVSGIGSVLRKVNTIRGEVPALSRPATMQELFGGA